MVTATLRKNLGPPVPQQNDDSYLQEDQEPQRGHLVRACALLRQLKPVILKWQPHSLKSLAAKQIRKTWILCYFMLWLPQKKARSEFQKTLQPSKMLHLMQIRMHVVWEYFSTSLIGVVGACEKLRDFFVQYLKF